MGPLRLDTPADGRRPLGTASARAAGPSPGETAALVDRILATPRAAQLGLGRPALARLPPAAVRQIAGQLGLAPGGGPGPGGISPIPLARPGRLDRPALGTAPKRDGPQTSEALTRAIGKLQQPKAWGRPSPGQRPGQGRIVPAPGGNGRTDESAEVRDLVLRPRSGSTGGMVPLPTGRLPDGVAVPGLTGSGASPGRPGITSRPNAGTGIAPPRPDPPPGRDTASLVARIRAPRPSGRTGARAPGERTTIPPGPGASLPGRAAPPVPTDRSPDAGRPDRTPPAAGRSAGVSRGPVTRSRGPAREVPQPSRQQTGPLQAGGATAAVIGRESQGRQPAGGTPPAGGQRSALDPSRLPGGTSPSGPGRAPGINQTAPAVGPAAARGGPRADFGRTAEKSGREAPAGRPELTRPRPSSRGPQPAPAPADHRADGPGPHRGVRDEQRSDSEEPSPPAPRPTGAIDEGKLEDLVRRLVERIVAARLAELERRLGLANNVR